MSLVKTSLLNAIAVVVKMLTLLSLNKILAVYVGPSGYAALGQFQNAIQMITTFASGAINNGVIKYTAEYYDNEDKQKQVWSTAGTIALFGSIFTAILIAILSESLSLWFLKDIKFRGVFIWFAFTLVLFVFNALFLAILNGKKEIKLYVIANVVGSLFALSITSLMAVKFGLYGALVALAIHQSLSFFATLFLCFKARWFSLNFLVGTVDKKIAGNLARYAAMALTSAACVPLSNILIRSFLGESFGWIAAGYWEAMWRLSSAYLMIVTTTLSVYYLPRLSEISDFIEIKKEIVQGYKLILPLVGISGFLIFLLRDFIIIFLFTDDFLPMRDLFPWQILGDTLKIGSWILAYLMISKAMTKLFIITEISFSILYVLLTVLCTKHYGLKGVTVAYSLNYLLYWIVMSMAIGKKFVGGRKYMSKRV